MHERLDQLLAAEAGVERAAQVQPELALAAERGDDRDGDQLAVAQGQAGPRPDLAEQVRCAQRHHLVR